MLYYFGCRGEKAFGARSVKPLSLERDMISQAPMLVKAKTSASQGNGVELRVIDAALRVIDTVAASVLVAALLGELILVLANVGARAYLHRSFLWADESARLTLSILAFIGGAVAYRRRDHAFVRVVINLLVPRIQAAFFALADVLVLFVAAVTGVASVEFISSSWGERTPILQLPAALIALPLPIGLALLALYALDNLRRDGGRMALAVAALLAALITAAAETRESWLSLLGGDAAIVVALTLFFVTIMAAVGFVLLLATATYLWAADAASLVVLPQTMVNGTGNFILLGQSMGAPPD
jgi:TRAP-type C4-dicarboxylate transport system permease small subunit